MRKREFSILTLALAFFLSTGFLLAQEKGVATKVMVRAVSHDAKVIGTKVGGARITIRQAATGKVLAEGMQTGGTGDTRRIMIEPRERGEKVYDTPGTAGFLATVMLEQPTVVEIIAEGPLGTPQSTRRATTTTLLVPGEDILGDGIILEIHGFTVEILAPAEDLRPAAGQDLDVVATVTMA